MGSYNLHLDVVEEHVIEGMRNVGGIIERAAKKEAPVRKTASHKKSAILTAEFERAPQTTPDGRRNPQLTAVNIAAARAQHAAIKARLEGRKSALTGKTAVFRPEAHVIDANEPGSTFTIRYKEAEHVNAKTSADIARFHGIGFAGGKLVQGGYLRRSIRADEPRVQGKRVITTVRTPAPYAVFVEFGTSRMKSHPFMLPALNIYRQGGPGRVAKSLRWR